MAHAFDTKLAKAHRTLVRDQVITLLSPLLKSAGGYLQAVIPFGGVVRSYTDELGITQLYSALNGRAPAIAVALGDKQYDPAGIGGDKWMSTIEVLVYFCFNGQRSLVDRQQADVVALADDTADPGVDIAMEHSEELLIGVDLDVSPVVKSLRPVREEELATINDHTLWVQTYSAKVTRSINHRRDLTEKLDSIRTVLRGFIPYDTGTPAQESDLNVDTDNLEPP